MPVHTMVMKASCGVSLLVFETWRHVSRKTTPVLMIMACQRERGMASARPEVNSVSSFIVPFTTSSSSPVLFISFRIMPIPIAVPTRRVHCPMMEVASSAL